MSFRPLRLLRRHWHKTVVIASSVVIAGSWVLPHLLATGKEVPQLIISDQERKERLTAVDPEALLQRVATLPIHEWSYRDDPEIRHIGPMAQDFHTVFPQLGKEQTTIAIIDALGVLFAAIQALEARTRASDHPRPRRGSVTTMGE